MGMVKIATCMLLIAIGFALFVKEARAISVKEMYNGVIHDDQFINNKQNDNVQDPKKKKDRPSSRSTKEWEEHFKYVFPGRIPGPKSKKAKIAVVGAGPSGVHMALLLKRNGFKEVEIFEANDEVGR